MASKTRKKHDWENRTEARRILFTTAQLASFFDSGILKYPRPGEGPVKHLSQLCIMLQAIVLEGWLDVALNIWKVPVQKQAPTKNGKSRKKSNAEIVEDVYRHAIKHHLPLLLLDRNQNTQLKNLLRDDLEEVLLCFRIRNCIAHGEPSVILTQGKRKRRHVRLTTLMKSLTHARVKELFERTARFSDCAELLIDSRYSKTPSIKLRRRLLTDITRINFT